MWEILGAANILLALVNAYCLSVLIVNLRRAEEEKNVD
jgi:hypothetical protein